MERKILFGVLGTVLGTVLGIALGAVLGTVLGIALCKVLHIAKNHLVKGGFCVGIDLFSRAVASQVSSALLRLTSVFGMGTGDPERHKHRLLSFPAIKRW